MKFKTKNFNAIYCKNGSYNNKYDNADWYKRYNSNLQYYKGYLIHRTDKPAVEWEDGTKQWYLNGQLHREGGPAIEWSDGDKEYWLNGEYYSKEEYYTIINLKNKKNVLDEI